MMGSNNSAVVEISLPCYGNALYRNYICRQQYGHDFKVEATTLFGTSYIARVSYIGIYKYLCTFRF